MALLSPTVLQRLGRHSFARSTPFSVSIVTHCAVASCSPSLRFSRPDREYDLSGYAELRIDKIIAVGYMHCRRRRVAVSLCCRVGPGKVSVVSVRGLTRSDTNRQHMGSIYPPLRYLGQPRFPLLEAPQPPSQSLPLVFLHPS